MISHLDIKKSCLLLFLKWYILSIVKVFVTTVTHAFSSNLHKSLLLGHLNTELI